MLRLIPPAGLKSFVLKGSLRRREAVFFLERELKNRNSSLVNRQGEIYQVYLPFYCVTGKVFDYQIRIEERTRVNEDGTEYKYTVETEDTRVKPWESSWQMAHG